MSAIYGMIDLQKHDLENDLCDRMSVTYKQCSIDKMKILPDHNVILGCGIQYFTKESVNEREPFYDPEKQIYYTADCFLDNRSELITELSLQTDLPDGEIAFQAYCKWGTGFLNRLKGCFAIGIYEKKTNTFYLFADHTSSRVIYYYFDRERNRFFFSNLIETIKAANPAGSILINEKMIAEDISLPLFSFLQRPEESAYCDIYKVLPGTYLQVNDNGVKIIEYWNPVKNRKTWNATREEYEKRFFELMDQTYAAIFRAKGQVGLTLSSGLDSTSVAAMAAPILDQKGMKLYTYTAVPDEKFQVKSPDPHGITNERSGVEKFIQDYQNIEPRYESYAGKTCYSESRKIMDTLEIPYGYRDSMVWLDEIYQHAQKDHCQTLLNAFSGNFTVSSGAYNFYLYDLLVHGRFVSFLHEYKVFCAKNGFSRRRYMKQFAIDARNTLFHIHEKHDDVEEYTVVREDVLEKYCIAARYNARLDRENIDCFQTRKSIYEAMFDKWYYSGNSEYDTKFLLKYHVLSRDPYATKDLIEFFLSLPLSAYCTQGISRFFIRHAFSGKIPDELLLHYGYRGVQSADWVCRLKAEWDDEKNYIYQTITSSKLFDLLNKDSFYAKFEKLEKEHLEDEMEILSMVMQMYIDAEFLNRNRN